MFYLALPLMLSNREAVDGGLGDYGLAISAHGCTNFAAAPVFGGWPLSARPQFQMFGGNVIVGAGMVVIGLATWLPAAYVLPGFAVAAAFGAIGGPMKDIPTAVLRQTRLPRTDVASAIRVYMVANSAGILLAMRVMPQAITAFGERWVTIACGGLIIGLRLLGLIRLAGWQEIGESRIGPVDRLL